MKRELNKLQQKTQYKCEACGKFHDEDETEVVIIKVVKGKNCELNDFFSKLPIHMLSPGIPASHSMYPGQLITGPSTGAPPIEYAPLPVITAKPRRNIVPPGVNSAMIPPGHPLHEQHGAKEFRQA